jgi:hypothetical protein
MNPWWKFVGLAAVAATVLLNGCVAVMAGAAGAGAVAYVRGELQADLDAPYEKAVGAAGEAVHQLQFASISERKDALDAVLIARTAEDKKVEIKVSRSGRELSRVRIRVGVFGDEAKSLTILERIKANL